MSLSKHLQAQEFISMLQGKSPGDVRSSVLERGWAWFDKHPEQKKLIQRNLAGFEFPCTDEIVSSVQEHVLLHYYEKIVPLCGDPHYLHRLVRKAVDGADGVRMLKEFCGGGKGILIALAHFGAVEFLAPYLSMNGLPLHPTLRFATEEFSQAARLYAQEMERSGLFNTISFIEIGRPGTVTALEMAAVLRKKEVLLSVFDEKTDYSVPVAMFNKTLWGGAGLDRLLRLCNAPVAVFNAFMVRADVGSYRLQVTEVKGPVEQMVQNMYKNLEDIVREYLEQWYFLHEEIPFVAEEDLLRKQS